MLHFWSTLGQLDAEQTSQKNIKAIYITEVRRFFFFARGWGGGVLEFTRVVYLINVLK